MNFSKYEECGFHKDGGEFEEILSSRKLRTVHISIFTQKEGNKPQMLLLRSNNNDLTASIEDRGENNKVFSLTTNDRFMNKIINVRIDKIANVMVKRYSGTSYDFIFEIENLFYDMSVFA